MTTRRQVILGAGSALAFARVGQAQARDRFAGVADRARGFAQMRALVIARGGDVVLAEAFRGPAVDRAVNVKSVSKTIVAALTGAAIDRGVLDGPAQTIGAVAPALIPSGADRRAASITVEDLVTMRAGLERTSGANYGPWVSSRNWVANALGRPFVAEPGGQMLYSTGSFHILGAVLAQASGESLLALARDWLGGPLGIEVPAWTRDPQGYYLGGNEMALSPLAMVRFGEMYRQGGTYNGRRVLSATWVAQSLVARTRSPYSGLSYGYGWFLGQARGVNYALARGYGGQVIAVVPERGVTVAITSDATLPARSGGYFGDLMRLIEDDIIPASA